MIALELCLAFQKKILDNHCSLEPARQGESRVDGWGLLHGLQYLRNHSYHARNNFSTELKGIQMLYWSSKEPDSLPKSHYVS